MANYTTLSNKNLFAQFLKTIKVNETIMYNKSIDDKVEFFQKLANLLADNIGIPRLKLFRNEKKVGSTIGILNPAEKGKPDNYSIDLYSHRVGEITVASFRRVATVLYHEMRHAEQYFRGYQYYYRSGGTDAAIGVSSNPANVAEVIKMDKSTAFNMPNDRINFGQKMMGYFVYGDEDPYKNDPNKSKEENEMAQYLTQTYELDGLVFQMDGYRILGSDPNTWFPKAVTAIKTTNKLLDPKTFDIQLLTNGTVKIDGQLVDIVIPNKFETG